MEDIPSFSLRKTDLRLFRGLEAAFRNLLKNPDLSAEDVVGIARAIRCVQRLPRCTPHTEVSVSLDYHSSTLVACSIVRLSSDELSADQSAASRLDEHSELESFPSFSMRINRDGAYEVDGDKEDFFKQFIADAEATNVDGDGYTITISDDSTPEPLQPFDEKTI